MKDKTYLFLLALCIIAVMMPTRKDLPTIVSAGFQAFFIFSGTFCGAWFVHSNLNQK